MYAPTFKKIAKRQYLSSCGTFTLFRRNMNGGNHVWVVTKKAELMRDQVYAPYKTLLEAESADSAMNRFSKLFV